jgi:epsilon-lactone hydrolase
VPSMRARVVKRGFIAALRAARFAGVGTIDPAAEDDVLEKVALDLRKQMEDVARFVRLPKNVRVEEALGSPVPGEWVTSDRAERDRVVMHLHGGGFMMGSPRTHRGLTAALSRVTRARVFVPDYRLAPEHPFPAALDDAVAAYQWLVEDVGVEPSRLAVTGDSAGGGLAVSTIVHARDNGVPAPACAALMSPWTDLACTGESIRTMNGVDPWLRAELIPLAARGYCGDIATNDPRLSPLYADLSDLPPLLVHAGSDEILLDDARRLVERAREAGGEASLGVFDGLWHVFHAFPGIPEGRTAWREIGAFVRRHTTQLLELAGDAIDDSTLAS